MLQKIKSWFSFSELVTVFDHVRESSFMGGTGGRRAEGDRSRPGRPAVHWYKPVLHAGLLVVFNSLGRQNSADFSFLLLRFFDQICSEETITTAESTLGTFLKTVVSVMWKISSTNTVVLLIYELRLPTRVAETPEIDVIVAGTFRTLSFSSTTQGKLAKLAT